MIVGLLFIATRILTHHAKVSPCPGMCIGLAVIVNYVENLMYV